MHSNWSPRVSLTIVSIFFVLVGSVGAFAQDRGGGNGGTPDGGGDRPTSGDGQDTALPLPGKGPIGRPWCWCAVKGASVKLLPQSIFFARRGVMLTPSLLDLTVETAGGNAELQLAVIRGATQLFLQGVGFGGDPVPQGWAAISPSRSRSYLCSGTIRELLLIQDELEIDRLDRYIRARIGAPPPARVTVRVTVEHEVELAVILRCFIGRGLVDLGQMRLGKVTWKREFTVTADWDPETRQSSHHQAQPPNPPAIDPQVGP